MPSLLARVPPVLTHSEIFPTAISCYFIIDHFVSRSLSRFPVFPSRPILLRNIFLLCSTNLLPPQEEEALCFLRFSLVSVSLHFFQALFIPFYSPNLPPFLGPGVPPLSLLPISLFLFLASAPRKKNLHLPPKWKSRSLRYLPPGIIPS